MANSLTPADYQSIARDLDQILIIEIFGRPAEKRRARKHKRTIFAAIHAQNVAEGLNTINDADLLAELGLE